MDAMVKVLEELGVDLKAKEHTGYTFKAAGFMDLHVDVWQEGERHMVAISHNGIQNGDSMADPDILCEVQEGLSPKYKLEKKLIPVHYQNDYLGIFQRARIYQGKKVLVSQKLTKSIKSFLNTWAKNIKSQGFKAG